MSPSTASARLAGERVQHLAELQRGVQRAGGAHERLVLAGARARRAPRPRAGRGRRRPGRPARGASASSSSVSSRRSRKIEIATWRTSPPQAIGTNSTDAAPKRSTRSLRSSVLAGGVDDVQRRAGGDHARRRRTGGRRAPARSRRSSSPSRVITCAVADLGALGDLEQQHLVDGERLVERVVSSAYSAVGARRARRGARDALQAARGGARLGGVAGRAGVAGGGDRVGNGGASPCDRGFTSTIGRAGRPP